MGNQVSSSTPVTGKVILANGSVQEFNQPVTAAELMLEYPQQVVVELKSATHSQQKPTVLPADSTLELDKTYLMVPIRRGKAAQLSAQQAHQILLRCNDVLRSKKLVNTSRILPLFARICLANSSDQDVDDFQVVGKKEILHKEEEEDGIGVDEEVDAFEKPEYLSRQVSGRSWKPSLDTIEEKKNEVAKSGPKLVRLASRVGKRVETKGLVWG